MLVARSTSISIKILVNVRYVALLLITKSKSATLEAGGEVLSSVEYLGLLGNENWASLPPLPLPRSSSYPCSPVLVRMAFPSQVPQSLLLDL